MRQFARWVIDNIPLIFASFDDRSDSYAIAGAVPVHSTAEGRSWDISCDLDWSLNLDVKFNLIGAGLANNFHRVGLMELTDLPRILWGRVG